MYFIKVSSNPNLGKGHINRCLRIRDKIKSEVTWFIDKGTKKLFSMISMTKFMRKIVRIHFIS